MAYDFRANQIRLNRIISSGSVPIYVYSSGSAADFQGGLNFPTANIGSDVFLFVSGSSTEKTLFGGDVHSSGSITTEQTLTAQAVSAVNVAGSLSISGFQYIGTNTPDTNFFISSPAGRFVVQSYYGGGVADIHSQGKISFSNAAAYSGTLSSSNTDNRTWNFPDASGDVLFTSRILAGPNITVNSHASGLVSITGSSVVASDYFFSRYANIIEASGSLYLSGALRTTTISASHGAFITGSFVQGVAGNEASGTNSHAEGYQTHALGDAAHSEGNNTIASNSYAHSEGINTTASGLYSHAEGNSSDASDDGAHAEGYNTTASGQYSHSEGYNSIASARGSHGEGEQTFATGVCSHAEGSGSVAYGEYSHAGGENTNAIGNSSQTGGNSTIASGSYQTVFGQYNTRNNTSSLFVVGNGTGDGDAFRHDILRVNSSSVEVSGSLTASAVVAGGVNITPITASLVFGGDGVNRASGSISGLFESGSLMTLGTIGKFDVEILAMDFNLQTGASWKYTATALWPYSGNFSFLAATELAAEYGPTAGLYNPAADWDVNFNSLGQIELTGSAAAFPSGGTSFYVQVTKKMVASYGTIIA